MTSNQLRDIAARLIAMADEMDAVKPPKKRKRDEPPDLPDNLNRPDFIEEWDLWCEYRRGRNQSMSPTYLTIAFKTLSEWGPDRAIAALKNSRESWWIKIVEPKKYRGDEDRAVAIRVT